jgi:hypothetical protein
VKQQKPCFTAEHIAAWRRDGVVGVERFFNTDEVAAVVADFEHVFAARPARRYSSKRRAVKSPVQLASLDV